MSNHTDSFRFKRFSVSHHRSSMKVGVDAVLLGSWASVEGARRILDVGTGCGVIALVCAQRNPLSKIIGVDIDGASVEEAESNFAASPWAERLEAFECDFTSMQPDDSEGPLDMVISNPPYFDSGVDASADRRSAARHQGLLNMRSLASGAARMLRDGGLLSVILPIEPARSLLKEAEGQGLELRRMAYVSGREGKAAKRLMVELEKVADTGDRSGRGVEIENIFVHQRGGEFSPRYLELSKDFYLHM